MLPNSFVQSLMDNQDFDFGFVIFFESDEKFTPALNFGNGVYLVQIDEFYWAPCDSTKFFSARWGVYPL